MSSQQPRQTKLLELRRLCDQYLTGANNVDAGWQQFRNAFLEKTLDELKTVSKELGISVADKATRKADVLDHIVALVEGDGGYRYVQGLVEVCSDGSGTLENVQLAQAAGSPREDDDYDIDIPPAIMQAFGLRGGESITGLRRCPYAGEEYIVMMRIDKVTRPHGPCSRCEHFRQAGSITALAYSAMLDPMKPRIGRAHSEKQEAERSASGECTSQLETAKHNGFEEWNQRPTGRTTYCGLDEFQGRYYVCEVKNLNERCDRFKPHRVDATAHNCRDCAHNAVPKSDLITMLQRTMSRDANARPLLQERVAPALDAEADLEYRECADAAGFLRTRPGMLPVCEALSSTGLSHEEASLIADIREIAGEAMSNREPITPREASFIVGPVVNSAGRCKKWQEGANDTTSSNMDKLQCLLAEAAFKLRLRQDSRFHKDKESIESVLLSGNYTIPFQDAVGNAESSVIEFCLETLGIDRNSSQSLGDLFMATAWYGTRERPADYSDYPEYKLTVGAPPIRHPRYPWVQIVVGKGYPPAQWKKLPYSGDGSVYLAYRYIDETWRYLTIASVPKSGRTRWQTIYNEKGEWVPFSVWILNSASQPQHRLKRDDFGNVVNPPLDSAEEGDSVGMVKCLP